MFVGSSSIRLWDTLAEDMAPLPVMNRGFGGSQLSHVIHFADRTVIHYRPRAVVLYAGDNDLDERTGKTADDVVRDFETFKDLVHSYVPDARVYYLSIKPSRMRWARWPEQAKANAAIAALCAGDPRLALHRHRDADARDAASRRARDLFSFDGLHLSEQRLCALDERGEAAPRRRLPQLGTPQLTTREAAADAAACIQRSGPRGARLSPCDARSSATSTTSSARSSAAS